MDPIDVDQVAGAANGWVADDPRRVSNAPDFIRAMPVLIDGCTPTDDATVVVPAYRLTYLLGCHKMSRAADAQDDIDLLSLISSVPSDDTFSLQRPRLGGTQARGGATAALGRRAIPGCTLRSAAAYAYNNNYARLLTQPSR